MFVTYLVVGIIVLIVGAIACIMYIIDDMLEPNEREFWRAVGIFTFGSWVAAISWPVLVACALPGLFVYGAVVSARAFKHRSIDY